MGAVDAFNCPTQPLQALFEFGEMFLDALRCESAGLTILRKYVSDEFLRWRIGLAQVILVALGERDKLRRLHQDCCLT